MHLNGKNRKMSFNGKNLLGMSKWTANGQKIYVYENILGPQGCLPLPWGYIHVHVYDHNIQTSSLKPFGQSKPNFMLSILRKSE